MQRTTDIILHLLAFSVPPAEFPRSYIQQGEMSFMSILLVMLGMGVVKPEALQYQDVECDILVVGGSTAGLSAAVTSAKEGQTTCLLEPTDMIGGQMTANGVPALDFTQVFRNGFCVFARA